MGFGRLRCLLALREMEMEDDDEELLG